MRLRDHEGVKGKRDAYPFDPRLLKIDSSYNVRDLSSPEAVEKLGDLKESIRANGVRTPLEVRLDGEDVFIVAGHRRHAAVMELIAQGEEIETVLVLHEPLGTNDAERTLNLVVSNSGEPLKPLEVAEVVRRLTAYGWDVANIAKRLGWKSSASVKQHLEMLAMPEGIKNHVKAGDISATLARNIAKCADPVEAEKLIQANLDENRRIKGKHQKVTAKTIKRDAKAAAKTGAPLDTPATPLDPPTTPLAVFAQPPEPETEPASGLPATPESDSATTGASELERHPINGTNGDASAAIFMPLTNQDIIDALGPIAEYANTNDLNERGDDEVIEVFARDIKRVALVYARVTGGEQ
jgi:ParB/RepB/Spo0J family partition protein